MSGAPLCYLAELATSTGCVRSLWGAQNQETRRAVRIIGRQWTGRIREDGETSDAIGGNRRGHG